MNQAVRTHIRRSGQRLHSNHGWLDAHHTFSFAGHHDPQWMGFLGLRVLNQDRIQPGTGFGTHGHRDMEIVTLVLQGAVAHRDNMGNEGLIRPGEIQRMRAGTGVLHSEHNGADEVTELLQMWLPPRSTGTTPGYDQIAFPIDQTDRLVTIVTPDDQPQDGAVGVDADAWLHAARLPAGSSVDHTLHHAPNAWLHVANGSATVDGVHLDSGDALGFEGAERIQIDVEEDATIIVWELA